MYNKDSELIPIIIFVLLFINNYFYIIFVIMYCDIYQYTIIFFHYTACYNIHTRQYPQHLRVVTIKAHAFGILNETTRQYQQWSYFPTRHASDTIFKTIKRAKHLVKRIFDCSYSKEHGRFKVNTTRHFFLNNLSINLNILPNSPYKRIPLNDD